MDVEELLERFGLMHDQGDSQAAIRLGEEVWPALETQPSDSGIASVCRFVTLAYYREKDYPAGDIWWHRAAQRFAKCGHLRGTAMMMITPAFRAAARGEFDMVEMVFEAMQAIVSATRNAPADHIGHYSWALRLLNEKRAYCLCIADRYSDALPYYAVALEAMMSGEGLREFACLRGELKVRGGAALARYYSSALPSERNAALEELRELLLRSDAAQKHGEHLVEVHKATEENLSILAARPDASWSELRHYDIA